MSVGFLSDSSIFAISACPVGFLLLTTMTHPSTAHSSLSLLLTPHTHTHTHTHPRAHLTGVQLVLESQLLVVDEEVATEISQSRLEIFQSIHKPNRNRTVLTAERWEGTHGNHVQSTLAIKLMHIQSTCIYMYYVLS